jgi:hypothetical protein
MNYLSETLTIGVLAEAAGVNVETIRFYQRKGLMQRSPIAPWARSPRGLREVEMKTPNREQLGVEYWWRNTEPNPRSPSETNDNTLPLSP